MASTSRKSYPARVRRLADDAEPASPTSRVVVQHHRTARAEWSVDVASGGHILHLAVSQCVFNNVLRIAHDRGLQLSDMSVEAAGGFDAAGTASTGIECSIELAGDADHSALIDIAAQAFRDSTVVAVLQRGGTVELTSVHATGRDLQPPIA